MDIVRNDDGSSEVPVAPTPAATDEDAEHPAEEGEETGPTTQVIRPGEGGYDEALAEWDAQQHPDRGPAVSTASGRQQAMAVVHAVAEDDGHDVAGAMEGRSSEPVAEALRHVLVGGEPSVADFASEVAEAEGGDPLPAHELTKVIGEVLVEIDG